jgi:sugar O-acyltransferase (sialic acid O-acetyltransferase NeuD family)
MAIAQIVRLTGEYELVGFLDDVNPQRAREEFSGAEVLGGREQLDALRAAGVDFLAVGFGRSEARLKAMELARCKGFAIPALIHPEASIAEDAQVGEGTVVRAGSVIDYGVRLGEGVIVAPGSLVSHQSVLEDGVRLATGAVVGAKVLVARCAFLGLNCTIMTNTHIGAGALIGIGAVVLRDVPDGTVAYGVPARAVRKATEQDFDGL